MIVIISAIFGSYDRPSVPIPQSVDVEYWMVTDNPHLRAPGWRIIYDTSNIGLDHPRTAAKRPKMQPWRYVAKGPWIWIDGSIEVRSRHFARDVAVGNTIRMWEHPDRDCILPEAELSVTLPKYEGVPVMEQAKHYLTEGHPEHWGLWAAGVIYYPAIEARFGNSWMNEIIEWGYQDQVSLPWVLRQLNMRPEPLEHGLRSNPWISIRPHRSNR